jgi:hypothetical protein
MTNFARVDDLEGDAKGNSDGIDYNNKIIKCFKCT